MDDYHDTNLLAWVLSALTVLIMGAAIGISSDGSGSVNPQNQGSLASPNASSPGNDAPLHSAVNAERSGESG